MKPRGANTPRLLCPQCADVKRVASIDNEQIVLVCGHGRAHLLPLEPGRISIENLRTAKGLGLFPANHESEVTSNRAWIEK